MINLRCLVSHNWEYKRRVKLPTKKLHKWDPTPEFFPYMLYPESVCTRCGKTTTDSVEVINPKDMYLDAVGYVTGNTIH